MTKREESMAMTDGGALVMMLRYEPMICEYLDDMNNVTDIVLYGMKNDPFSPTPHPSASKQGGRWD
jgi:hypothetical protein